VSEVGFDGLEAHEQRLGDLGIRGSGGRKLRDAQLAGGERGATEQIRAAASARSEKLGLRTERQAPRAACTRQLLSEAVGA
jgi:hypothetical protein